MVICFATMSGFRSISAIGVHYFACLFSAIFLSGIACEGNCANEQYLPKHDHFR